MLLNFNDPSSIVSWWRVFPERHGLHLRAIARMNPAWANPIRKAFQIVQGSPELSALLAQAKAAREADQEAGEATLVNEYAAMAMGA